MNLIPREKSAIANINENSLYFELYSEEEKELLTRLKELFSDWHKLLSKHNKNISFDGFYPGYLKQKVKLLFIGKENRGLSNTNYLEALYAGIKGNDFGEINRGLNRYRFHYMMLYLSYALQKGENDYSKIPGATDVSKEFGTEVSFAFMNLSKFSNEGENSEQADLDLIRESIDISTKNETGRNFIYEEILLLDPDVVVTMSLMGQWKDRIADADKELLKPIETKPPSNAVASYELKLGEKTALLLDTYHFSARNKKDKEDFFDPIMNTIQSYIKQKASGQL